MDLSTLLAGVEARTGQLDRTALESATRATLRGLGGQLGGVPPALHDPIPTALHPELHAGTQGEPLAPGQLYAQIAAQTGLRPGQALELAQSTMAELSAHLAEASRDQLRALLPPAWSALVLDPPDRTHPPGPHPIATEAGRGHTLATGRPGGSRPLAEASLPAGQADSIATSDDPHPERLATATGPGPQRDDHTLSRGRPGSRHPVADSDD